MSKVTHSDIEELIAAQLQRQDLSATDVLQLTLARRLNQCSDNTLGKILGGVGDPPLNIWNKR